MIPLILAGGVALWGGYKAKKFLDAKIADDENFYSGYKDAAFGEFGKAFVKGTNRLCEKFEDWTGEPQFATTLENECSKLTREFRELKHFGGQTLCPTLIKQEQFALAKTSRQRELSWINWGDDLAQQRYDELDKESSKLEKLVEVIYSLEDLCYQTHSDLKDLAQQFKRLEHFAPNMSLPMNSAFTDNLGENKRKSPIYERIAWYSTYSGRFDLQGYDENALEQIRLMSEHISAQDKELRAKTALLFELINAQKYASKSVVDDTFSSVALNKKLVQKEADFEKFTPAQQKELVTLALKAEYVSKLINADFVEFYYEDNSYERKTKWKTTQTLIDEAKAGCKAEFGDEIKWAECKADDETQRAELSSKSDESEVSAKKSSDEIA